MSFALVITFALMVLGISRILQHRLPLAANIAEGTHRVLTKRATAAIADRNLLVKFGATADLIAVAGKNDFPLGPCPDEPEAANDPVSVLLLGVTGETVKMVASEDIDPGEEVYTAAAGEVSLLSAVAGTYYKVGLCLVGGAADDVIVVLPCYPVATVVSG